MFKRRKTDDPDADDPTAGETATLPAGLPDAGTEQTNGPDLPDNRRGAPVDSGLGVPPFRPAPPKEAHFMARSPFASPQITPTPPAPPGAPLAPPVVRTGLMPPRPATRDPSDRRTLVVGRGISVQGTVQDAERLVVEGTVEATMIHATELAVAPGGMFKGEVEVEDAEIAGTINGTLTVRGSLVIRATGRVLGNARCHRLQVEDGGQISGQMEMLTEGAKADQQPRTVVESAA
ncbi:MAG TPA: polymer-forming cytoskeletal protein [Acetobacteraceae bacterium]|nr:polymer-forming cytoskeletal protein [Acetobacteraceae bacterium]